MPGVQMPHCAAPCARNALRSRSVSPPGPGPSTVWIAAPLRLTGGDEAGAGLLTVEEHRAGAAVAGVAADLGAGKPEAVAQRTGEARERIGGDGDRIAVDPEAGIVSRVGHAALRLATCSGAAESDAPRIMPNGISSDLLQWDSPPPCGEGLGVGGLPTSGWVAVQRQ